MNKPEPLPFATNGRVLWAQVPGFPAWWKSHAPNLSNHEVAAEVERVNLKPLARRDARGTWS